MRLILAIHLVLASTQILGQQIIEGLVQDRSSQPIVGANVYWEGSYEGTSTDQNGRFYLEKGDSSHQFLIISYLGYQTFREDLSFGPFLVPLAVVLEESINRMDAVVLTAGTFEAGGESKREIMKAVDIVTTAGATADISGALNTLPGTQLVGEEGRLFVRGGDHYETRTFIDGMMVLNEYGTTAPNTPARNRFSPFMFSGTSFSTGGYSAEYGFGMSSVLVLNTKDLPDQDRADISIMSVGADLGYSKRWDRSSLVTKIQYINIDPYYQLIKQKTDWVNPPTSLNGNFAYRLKVGNQGLLKVYSQLNRERFSLNQVDIDDPELKTQVDVVNDYSYLNISYRGILSEKWSLQSGLSHTSNSNWAGVHAGSAFNDSRGSHGKMVLINDVSPSFSMKYGSELVRTVYSQEIWPLNSPSVESLELEELVAAGFAEGDFYFSNALVARLGVRMEHSNLQDTIYIEPRFSMAYKTSEWSQISLSYGQFHQAAPPDIIRVAPDLRAERARHYILNYQASQNGRTFRIEGFYKDYRNLARFDPLDPTDPISYRSDGQGYATGFDLFWRDNQSIKNVDYWVSYSFLNTERLYRDYPYPVTPSYASAHNFSVVYKHFLEKIRTQIGATYRFASGRPYQDPNQTGFNDQLTPNYHDLGVNLSYLYRSHVIIHASVTNLMGRENIFGYEFSDQVNSQSIYNGRAIGLPATRFYFLGIFITLTKNKTINQLPNL